MPDSKLSPRSKTHLQQILDALNEKKYVFLLGPRGSGKTRLIKAAIPEIQKQFGFVCHYFDLETAVPKGAYALYNEVLKAVSDGKSEELKAPNLSDVFITEIEAAASRSEKIIVLIFDVFRAVNSEFYDNFAIDCRKIFSQAQENPNSGLGKILMIFAGSFIGYAQNETSPLWNITEHISISNPDEQETYEIIRPLLLLEPSIQLVPKKTYWENPIQMPADIFDYIKKITVDMTKSLFEQRPIDTVLQFIFQSTQGHVSLSKALARFFAAQKNWNNTNQILEEFIDHIWKVSNTNEQNLESYDKKLKRHFVSIVEYLETIPDILRTVLDRLDGKEVYASSPPRSIDHIVITGAIQKNDKGCYEFTNMIYQKFFEKLLDCHRKGDFCVFHVQEPGMWKRAKEIYSDLQKQKIPRNIDEPISPRSNHFSYLSSNLVNQLRSYDKASDFIDRFKDYLTYIFDIQLWGIYHIDRQNKALGRPDFFFRTETKIENKTGFQKSGSFIERILRTKTPNFDWTGRWLAIPFMIREDYERIFVACVEPNQMKLLRPLSEFIQSALAVSYRIQYAEKSQKQTELLQDILLHEKKSQRGDLNLLWAASKRVIQLLNIDKFVLHEIIENDSSVLTTNSDQSELMVFSKKEPINEKLKKAVKTFRDGNTEYSDNDLHFIGKPMASGNMMVIELNIDSELYKNIRNNLLTLMNFVFTGAEIGVKLYDAEKQFHILKRTLNDNEDFIYVIDREKRILFMNEKLRKFIRKELEIHDKNIEGICYKIFPDKSCNPCPVDRFFSPEDPSASYDSFKMVREFILSKRYVFETTYIPIKDDSNNQIIAVAVYMYDVTERDFLLECLSNMARLKTIKQIDDFIFEALNCFGFQRAFRWRYDADLKRFVSEGLEGEARDKSKADNFKKGLKDFDVKHEELLKDRVIVWYRKNTPRKLKLFLEDRLRVGIGEVKRENLSEVKRENLFEFKESTIWPEHDPENPKTDFWVTIPIFGREGIRRLYVVDNWGDDDLDKELINLDKLQMLETFARSASQIRENARKSRHIKQALKMLPHTTKERMATIRSLIQRSVRTRSTEERKEIVEKADANIKMLQTLFNRLLSTEPRDDYFEHETVNLNERMEKLLGIYKAYSGGVENIQFELHMSEEQLEIDINVDLLEHIFNNLVGNAIHHLTHIKQDERKIYINVFRNDGKVIIDIADNGKGLPDEYRKNFRKPFLPDYAHTQKGFGIIHSRQMAFWMGADLELVENTYFKTGTQFRLTLN